MSSSLSSVVSDLVRASMGSSVPATVVDDELDRYVADLIIKEAKQKAERYLEEGVQAYLPDRDSNSNLPRANKRFLSAIIRNTDEHNRAILRTQAEAAQEAKADREEQERRERRVRALEATEAERLRRLMGGPSRRRDAEWDRRQDGGRRRRSRDSRDDDSADDRDDYRDRRKRRHRSRSPLAKEGDIDRHKRRRSRNEEREDSSSRKHRRRSRSKSSDNERHKSSRKQEGSGKHKRRDETPELLKRPKGKGKEVERPQIAATSSRSSTRGTPRDDMSPEPPDEDHSKQSPRRSLTPPRKPSPADLSAQFQARKAKLAATPPPPPSPTLSEEEDIERYRPRRKKRTPPGASAAAQDDTITPELPSKMDKYFEESYDPRLDTGPLTVPNVPSTGLIEGTEFERWEAMLDIIRQRREDKAERKRLERLGLLPDKKSKEKDGKSPKPTEAWTMESGTSALDIKYSKRGSVREWDLGKAGF
ncbi:hypothetical protein ACEPAI_297 [Sanghuangporus weigelae]